mmetsp:Transcript_18663/g.57854  ORF Transcript_18663/g.57854 Transcript_18663/m.57854 type:complete len:232 (-) Transcript_18663:679-1374(-)
MVARGELQPEQLVQGCRFACVLAPEAANTADTAAPRPKCRHGLDQLHERPQRVLRRNLQSFPSDAQHCNRISVRRLGNDAAFELVDFDGARLLLGMQHLEHDLELGTVAVYDFGLLSFDEGDRGACACSGEPSGKAGIEGNGGGGRENGKRHGCTDDEGADHQAGESSARCDAIRQELHAVIEETQRLGRNFLGAIADQLRLELERRVRLCGDHPLSQILHLVGQADDLKE